MLGFLASDRTDLAGLQSGFGQNLNSKTNDPLFVGANDLHLQNSSTLLAMGVAIIGFTSDFDVPADMRDTPPDIGADEIVAVIAPGTLQFSSTSYTGTEGATATITVSRSAGSSGSVSVDYATSNGTATAGTCGTAGSDYQPASGTLTFAEGVVG